MLSMHWAVAFIFSQKAGVVSRNAWQSSLIVTRNLPVSSICPQKTGTTGVSSVFEECILGANTSSDLEETDCLLSIGGSYLSWCKG
uniref:Uncharacterized protein n=1 Tax=Neovison vison TaxID=452646 RepID=A0A8C7AZV5_NEOVI